MKILSRRRHGFSLMEMIIATAMLAGSGAALFALVGQASRLARTAEERTVALQLAQTVMDEFLAMPSESETETEGTFESDPRWSYRMEQTEVTLTREDAGSEDTSSPMRVVVAIYRANDGGTQNVDSAIVRLVRWIRPARTNSVMPAEEESSMPPKPEGSEPAVPEGPEMQGLEPESME
ncbi:type IV pilus modification PilV family protein [Novipirellula artificiosorum]|uniref:Uncharacterized protein n=1 Tax=Novipirellula artificiosorum TaxID=2528016 RepID=A0A5C6DNV8_9BACT|nr:type II secretion system protein [Novipirellula artificiosorum]TWU38480.1 hypothetical protein Poly41_29560 [Novipirellula artificiosorum]